METKLGTINLHEKKWLVVYTRPRWEKKVDRLLKRQGIESYCPLRYMESQWADRKKEISLPLFSSYVFVRVNLREESMVLYCLGVLGYVYYMQRPAVVRDEVIEEIRRNLTLYKDVEIINLQSIAIGDRVQVKQGAFINQLGQVVQINGKNVLMIFDNIHCALVTRIPFQHIAIHNLNQDNKNATK
ncbi:UpxY family transcription antiterminator [Mucilaginibacter sp. SP1R1]|uniref:UpxY family transcription antiterminator n=1 Tax=Mucilaginibacter sp. SP1R1 TaxID=2723091 RepID=UPI00161CAD18|nr:UpxY family transcription antiterminator [Mucilaginibacter sp. SP1R1]MBB6151130.1 transcription antitermination factor NusG [Mucilaginibacter sp. SP1R1]